MAATRVSYVLEGGVASITLDDGKMNVMSPPMFAELNAALDRAEADGAVVLLAGREGVFSAGFDLSILQKGNMESLSMLRSGLALSERLLSFPMPVVAACPGHAIALGLFMLLCADYRVGAEGDFKLVANEVLMGLPIPRVALEVCRQRLSPGHYTRVTLLAEVYDPRGAIEAGMLDEIVPHGQVLDVARAKALELTKVDARAHATTKLRARQDTLEAIRRFITLDMRDIVLEGARRFVQSKTRKARG